MGLVNNVKDLVSRSTERTLGLALEHALHLLVGLTDVFLGVAGLALTPGSLQKVYDTLKDEKAPMTFRSPVTNTHYLAHRSSVLHCSHDWQDFRIVNDNPVPATACKLAYPALPKDSKSSR